MFGVSAQVKNILIVSTNNFSSSDSDELKTLITQLNGKKTKMLKSTTFLIYHCFLMKKSFKYLKILI